MDDGTVGKYGAEVRLRRELEKTINQQRIHASKGTYKFVIVEIILGILMASNILKRFFKVLISFCSKTTYKMTKMTDVKQNRLRARSLRPNRVLRY